jgi:PAS domain S-box-containing protein
MDLGTFSNWRRPKWGFAFAAVAFLICFALRYAATPWLEGEFPFITFLPAAIITTLFAGLWPGVFFAVLGGLGGWYFFAPPQFSFSLNPAGTVGLLSYAFVTTLGIAVTHALQRSLERLQDVAVIAETARHIDLMFEANPNGLLVVDKTGHICMVNGHLAKMFGYAREDLIGQAVEILIPVQFRAHHPALRTVFAAAPSARPMGAGRDLYGLCNDGTEFPIEIGLSPFQRDGHDMVLATIIDITERKRLENEREQLREELAESEERFRDIAANFPGTIFRRVTFPDESVQYPYVSRSIDEVFGIPGKSIRMAADWASFMNHEDLANVWQAFRESEANMTTLETQFRFLDKQGNTHWVHSISRPRRRDDGAVVWDGVALDITDRKRLEIEREKLLEDLAESENRFRDIAANFPGMIFRRVAFPDGSIEYPYCSKSAADFCRVPVEAMRTPDDLCRFMDHEDIKKGLHALREAEATMSTLDTQHRYRDQDGDMRWVHSISRPRRRDDGAVVWDGVAFDITDRKRLENEREQLLDELAKSEERLRDIAENFPGAIFRRVTFPDGSVQYPYMSRSLAEVFQLPSGWRVRQHQDLGLFMDQEEVESAMRAIRDAEAKMTTVEIEGRIRDKDGNVRWARSISRPRRQDDGTVVWDGVLLDVTAHKHAEESLKLVAQELEHRGRNLLMLIKAMVRRTRAETVEDFIEALDNRIDALARTHKLLSANRFAGTDLERLITDEILPYSSPADSRVQIQGPNILLNVKASESLGMVVHELATNAAKYGALSRSNGRIVIKWSRYGDEQFDLHWIETGVPTLKPPDRQGFGTRVIEDVVQKQLRGETKLEWTPDGLHCDIKLPVREIFPRM